MTAINTLYMPNTASMNDPDLTKGPKCVGSKITLQSHHTTLTRSSSPAGSRVPLNVVCKAFLLSNISILYSSSLVSDAKPCTISISMTCFRMQSVILVAG